MNKLFKQTVASAALATLSMAATAAPIDGGNAPIDRTFTDSFANFTILDRNNVIDGTGVLTQWQIYAGTTGQVELLIFRPTGLNTYDLIADSADETPVLGLNTFATNLSVQANDVVGLRFFSAGSVDYTLDAPGSNALGNLTGTVLYSANGGGATNVFADSTNRTYSVYVSGVTAPVPEPETYAMMLAGLGALGFMARRRQGK